MHANLDLIDTSLGGAISIAKIRTVSFATIICSGDTSASADLRHEWRYIKCTFTLHYIIIFVSSHMINLDSLSNIRRTEVTCDVCGKGVEERIDINPFATVYVSTIPLSTLIRW